MSDDTTNTSLCNFTIQKMPSDFKEWLEVIFDPGCWIHEQRYEAKRLWWLTSFAQDGGTVRLVIEPKNGQLKVTGDLGPMHEDLVRDNPQAAKPLLDYLNRLSRAATQREDDARRIPKLTAETPQLTTETGQRQRNASTDAKVREAHRLLVAGTPWKIVKKTCSHETYMRHCFAVTGEEPIAK